MSFFCFMTHHLKPHDLVTIDSTLPSSHPECRQPFQVIQARSCETPSCLASTPAANQKPEVLHVMSCHFPGFTHHSSIVQSWLMFVSVVQSSFSGPVDRLTGG